MGIRLEGRQGSMSIFGNILSKFGLGRDHSASTPAATPGTAPASGGTATAAPAAVAVVDVEAHMEHLASKVSHPVNWRESIVDLLSLLGIDNSYADRKELAVELGC